MSKAKRKKKAIGFGQRSTEEKKSKHIVTIQKSEISDNFLIIIDEKFCFDSAQKYKDAVKVKNWLEKANKKNPLSPNTPEESFLSWIQTYAGDSPDVKSISWILQR